MPKAEQPTNCRHQLVHLRKPSRLTQVSVNAGTGTVSKEVKATRATAGVADKEWGHSESLNPLCDRITVKGRIMV